MKLVLTGANGQLGKAFCQEFTRNGISFCSADRTVCDITQEKQVEQVLDTQKPTVLINCAAYNLVDEAESNRQKAFDVNTYAVKILTQACHKRGIKCVHYSSDYVFDGKKGAPYTEEDFPSPLNVYGQSKLEGEAAVRAITQDYLIFRTSWVYGAGQQNFLYKLSQWAKTKDTIKVSDDEFSVPTFVEDIVQVTLKALEQELRGLYHLTSSGQASRFEWAKAFIKASGLQTQILPVAMSSFMLKAQRPAFSAMSNETLSDKLKIKIPSWQEGVEKFVQSIERK